jgi:hypothetical protein
MNKYHWLRFSTFSGIAIAIFTVVTLLANDTIVMLWSSMISFTAGLWVLFYLRVKHKLRFPWEKKPIYTKEEIKKMMHF